MELSKELLIDLYTTMVRIRRCDEKVIECLFAGKLITFYHSCQGQEAPGTALGRSLRKDDYLYYNHRGHGLPKVLPKGMSPKTFIAEHYGRATGAAKGYAGFHNCDIEIGIPGMGGMVGGEATLAAGTALACKLRGKGQVTANMFGDGATGRGPFHEAMLMSATWKLPLIWCVENNRYQQWTCISLTHPKEDLADFAHGYGIPSAVVDGQDVIACYEALQPAIERARAGKGPTLLEFKTYRFRPHVEGFPDFSVQCEGGCRPEFEVEEWKKRDPIKLMEATLLEKGVLTEADIERIHREATEEMEEADRFSADSPWPDPKGLDQALYAD
ncbi:MAG: thiamine pyrophosphate-dependent dehydrogenase E1 component subunit alpha [Desulfobacterales bacterium]|nr:MAG: thiamine pyrophosphate-dependent dehydrogenase E1 component subunit alpha [Desulfobacterales bacterium]